MTGALHMGHALNGSIQDALVRWHRMRGFNTLWQPGFDHAGIATQAVVEKELRRQGTSRQEIGRDAFVERVWEWLREYGGEIMSQFRRLGCSLDYERERFTMDEDYIRAVMHFFVHLYDRGLLYRDNRIINWCSDCRTSISDLEVEYLDLDDALTTRVTRSPRARSTSRSRRCDRRRYPPTSPSPCTRTTSATGTDRQGSDRAVVERRVPVIADERVDPDFGTGALKITPGHDPLDFEIGRDHGLPEPAVIGFDGRMRRHPAEAHGPHPGGGRGLLVEWLRNERGLLEKREHYRHSVGHCERSGHGSSRSSRCSGGAR